MYYEDNNIKKKTQSDQTFKNEPSAIIELNIPRYNIFSTNHNTFCLFVSYIDEILFSAFLIKYKMSGAI